METRNVMKTWATTVALLLISSLSVAGTASDIETEGLRAAQLLACADSLYGVQQYKDALAAAQEALPKARGAENEADCLNLLAIINIRLADYQEAARYAKQCYALDEKTGDPDVMSSSLNTLAAIYMGANQPKVAEQYVLKGIEMARKADNPQRMAVLQAMASEVYHAQGDDRKALPYIERAYDIDKQAGNEPRAMVRLAQKASILIGLHDYRQAEQVLARVIPQLRQSADRHSLAIALNKMGMALHSQQRQQEALPYYREAAAIFVDMGDIYNEVHARRGLYESLWETDPEAARQELDRFNTLKDSIYSRTSADQLAKYNAEFGNDWLKLENHAERQAKRRAVAVAAAIALIALVALVAWWLMRRRQQRQARVNALLRQHISELTKKYDVLNEHYNNALATSPAKDGQTPLSDADRSFVESTQNVISELLLTGQIDVRHVAARMGMSPFQLRQRLSAITGETPQSFIQNARMKRARHLLDNHPEMNISEIATLCAYNDTPNFTRAFKKTFGITPTQYQERLKS